MHFISDWSVIYFFNCSRSSKQNLLFHILLLHQTSHLYLVSILQYTILFVYSHFFSKSEKWDMDNSCMLISTYTTYLTYSVYCSVKGSNPLPADVFCVATVQYF
jgi:hypothetical protein